MSMSRVNRRTEIELKLMEAELIHGKAKLERAMNLSKESPHDVFY